MGEKTRGAPKREAKKPKAGAMSKSAKKAAAKAAAQSSSPPQQS